MEKFEREEEGETWTGVEAVTRIISFCVKLGNEQKYHFFFNLIRRNVVSIFLFSFFFSATFTFNLLGEK